MSLFKIKSSVVLVCLMLSGYAVASPTSNYAEIIPGPGLPSLESLGLTTADLYQKQPDISINARDADSTTLSKRVNLTCQNFNMVPSANAAACVTYLKNLGKTACTVSGENVKFCTSGQAAIWGSNITGHSVSSYCSDVAIGAQNIMNACQANGKVQGYAAANGNGDIIVSIETINGA